MVEIATAKIKNKGEKMTKNKKGFTIIEVVLVLAIAGLIFLMVFIALPALQRSQRNTQREDDLSRFVTAVNDYQSNNNGKTPFSDNKKLALFTQRYIDTKCEIGSDGTLGTCEEQFTDPDGEQYEWSVQKDADAGNEDVPLNAIEESRKTNGNDAVDHKLYVIQHSGCGGEEQTYTYDSGSRNFSIMYRLEGGSTSCNDNH